MRIQTIRTSTSTLADVEPKVLQQQRDDAQARLDAALREPAMHELVAKPGTFVVEGGVAVGETS